MIPRAGQLLLLVLLLVIMFLFYDRPDASDGVGPILLSPSKGKVIIELAVNDEPARIHQYFDTITPFGVMELTHLIPGRLLEGRRGGQQRLNEGARLVLVVQIDEVQAFSVSWMSAAKRIALGIPLHPDRMTAEDWQVLPGVGAKMAAQIEKERQENGDFGDFCNLARVPGIGKKRLTSWNQYFFNGLAACK